MKFELKPFNRNASDKELIKDLQRVARSLGKNKITIEQYNKHGRFNSSTLQRRFGGWLNTLKKANLEQTRIYGVSNEEYFHNIEHVWTNIGRQPYYRDMEKPLSKYSKKAYWHRFGSWRKALEEFVKYTNSDEDVKKSFKIKQLSRGKSHRTNRNISWRMRFLVMRRDNFRCSICGTVQNIEKDITLHVDHIVPWTKGGETVMGNLQTLCNKCNIGKSNLSMRNNI